MTNMVSCWQKNDYDDKACKQQISTFLQCIRNSVRQPMAVNPCMYLRDFIGWLITIASSSRKEKLVAYWNCKWTYAKIYEEAITSFFTKLYTINIDTYKLLMICIISFLIYWCHAIIKYLLCFSTISILLVVVFQACPISSEWFITPFFDKFKKVLPTFSNLLAFLQALTRVFVPSSAQHESITFSFTLASKMTGPGR